MKVTSTIFSLEFSDFVFNGVFVNLPIYEQHYTLTNLRENKKRQLLKDLSEFIEFLGGPERQEERQPGTRPVTTQGSPPTPTGSGEIALQLCPSETHPAGQYPPTPSRAPELPASAVTWAREWRVSFLCSFLNKSPMSASHWQSRVRSGSYLQTSWKVEFCFLSWAGRTWNPPNKGGLLKRCPAVYELGSCRCSELVVWNVPSKPFWKAFYSPQATTSV